MDDGECETDTAEGLHSNDGVARVNRFVLKLIGLEHLVMHDVLIILKFTFFSYSPQSVFISNLHTK